VNGAPVSLTTDPGGSLLASQPAPSLAAAATLALDSPSNVTPFDLYQLLGQQANADIAALIGPFDQIIDPSGNAADDFLTADSISAALAAIHPDAATVGQGRCARMIRSATSAAVCRISASLSG
jgi:hypothetical protein